MNAPIKPFDRTEDMPRKGFVYCITSASLSACKIGFSANPERRLREIQVAHPDRLVLIAVIPADEVVETAFHTVFRPMKIRGEWYSDTGGLLSDHFADLSRRAAAGEWDPMEE